MSYPYEAEDREHECPTPLAQPVADFDVGGMFFSPAGRWETIIDRSPREPLAFQVQLCGHLASRAYDWTFSQWTTLPYLPPSRRSGVARVAVFELATSIDAEVTTQRRYAGGHTVVTARLLRGSGWEVTDMTGGTTPEHVTVPSKARARSEVNRRARAHAKRLDLPFQALTHRTNNPGEVSR
jgi:hypothetical protein